MATVRSNKTATRRTDHTATARPTKRPQRPQRGPTTALTKGPHGVGSTRRTQYWRNGHSADINFKFFPFSSFSETLPPIASFPCHGLRRSPPRLDRSMKIIQFVVPIVVFRAPAIEMECPRMIQHALQNCETSFVCESGNGRATAA